MSTETTISTDRHTSIIASMAMLSVVALVVLPVTCVMHGRELDARKEARQQAEIERAVMRCDLLPDPPSAPGHILSMSCEIAAKPRRVP